MGTKMVECPNCGYVHKPFRITGQALENHFKAHYPADNEYGIPEIKPCNLDLDGIEWIRFRDWTRNDDRKKTDFSNVGIHFFIEDYEFNAVWTNPDKYLDIFKQCKAVATPDFSLYSDMPKALQIYNVFIARGNSPKL